VLIRLLDTLAALAAKPRTAGQMETLHRHAEAVMQAAERSIGHPADLADVERRYADLRRA
jgi:uncharacterized membrane protein